MTPITALYDACVLYPAPLRDLLMNLALTDLFRARWTSAIHEEWIRNLLESRPDLTRARLERTRDQMNLYVRGCLIEGYEGLIPTLTLPDPDDRHILAAAIQGEANVIVTFNLRDFPPATLQQYGIVTQHPDIFVSDLLSMDTSRTLEAVQAQRANLRNPPNTASELLDTPERQGLTQTVARLRPLADRI